MIDRLNNQGRWIDGYVSTAKQESFSMQIVEVPLCTQDMMQGEEMVDGVLMETILGYEGGKLR